LANSFSGIHNSKTSCSADWLPTCSSVVALPSGTPILPFRCLPHMLATPNLVLLLQLGEGGGGSSDSVRSRCPTPRCLVSLDAIADLIYRFQLDCSLDVTALPASCRACTPAWILVHYHIRASVLSLTSSSVSCSESTIV
jgi:hypothetical protein